jgi:hypothetical protein
MSIEWGPFPDESKMTMLVHDNNGSDVSVLDAGLPFLIHVEWEVPAPLAAIIGGNFRLRAYAESIGPGQEIQVGDTTIVPATPGTTNYAIHIPVPGMPLGNPARLLGEGEVFGGVPVSGMYKFGCVLQHLNPGPNDVSGYAEGDTLFLRTP